MKFSHKVAAAVLLSFIGGILVVLAAQTSLQLAILLAVGIVGGIFGGWYYWQQQFAQTIAEIIQATQLITLDEPAHQLHAATSDEFGQLALAFNTMAGRLNSQAVSLLQERDHLAASIRDLPLGFILTDEDSKIVTMNPVMRKMLGLPTELDAHGTQPLNLEIIDRLMAQVRRCLETGKYMEVTDASFKSRYLRIFLSPVIEHGHTRGVIVLVEDVTEAKVLERSKDEFFSIASHELRTPLTAIRGNTSMLKEYFPQIKENPDISAMLNDIHDSSVRLIEIVNDFLDASRLEQGRMKLTAENFAVDEVIEKVIYEFGSISREKNVKLISAQTLGHLPLVHADKNRVKQVIYNLLGNAMKFISEGSVTISGEVMGDHLKINVSDTGRGISPDGQKLLFHKFQQTGSSPLTRDATRGTGLGLYISKLLLEQMDGTIALEHSEVGKGSSFSFTLPVAGAAANPAAPQPSPDERVADEPSDNQHPDQEPSADEPPKVAAAS